MRIAPDDLSVLKRQADNSDDYALCYLRQKANGNIEKAKQLAERFMGDMLLLESKNCFGTAKVEMNKLMTQLEILFVYAVNQAINDCAPNAIIAQTILNSFYDRLKEADPAVYRLLDDTGIFSYYILCSRSPNCTSTDIGNTFAKACGCDGDSDMVRTGSHYYEEIYDRCTSRFHEVSFDRT